MCWWNVHSKTRKCILEKYMLTLSLLSYERNTWVIKLSMVWERRWGRRGRCEGCDFLSVRSTRRHFSIHSNQDESGMFARGLRTCAHTHTHTYTLKVSQGRITSQQKSLLCLFQSGEIVSKISHPITSVTVLLVRVSLVCVCTHTCSDRKRNGEWAWEKREERGRGVL